MRFHSHYSLILWRMKWKIAMKWGKKSLRCFLKSPAQFLQIPTPALPKGARASRGSLPQLLQRMGERDWRASPGPSKGGESEIGATLLR